MRVLRPAADDAQPLDIDRARQAGRGSESVRLTECPLQRPVAAHRQPGDKAVLPTGRDAKERADQLRQLVRQERPVAAAERLVRVEAAVHLWHDDGQAERRYVPLD